jgi:hypothetical protein
MEIWKNHKEFNYEISNYGNVRRIGKVYIDKNGIEIQKETKILKPKLINGFSAQITFSKTENKKTKLKRFTISKLVAELFLPKPNENEILLEHLDKNPLNNNSNNLKWITRKEWNEKNRKMIEKRTKLALKIRNNNKLKKKITTT